MGKKCGKKKVITCVVCNGTENKPVVACDQCEKWHHFECVGIKTIGKKDEWLCNNCKPTINPSTSSSQLSRNVVVSPINVNLTLPSGNQKDDDTGNDYDLRYDRRHPYYRANQQTVLSEPNILINRHIDRQQNQQIDSTASISSRISNISHTASYRQRIELEIIEEERILQEKRDYQYLEQKFHILMQGKQTSQKGSEASRMNYSSSGRSYMKNWIEQQRTNKPANIILETNKANLLNESGFINKLDAIRLESVFSSSEKTQIPLKGNNQPNVHGIDNLLRCEVCNMVGDEHNFDGCLLCFKQCHFACMDIILIDNDTRYICPKCKNSNHKSSPQKSSVQPNQLNTKSNVNASYERKPEHLKQRCGICGHSNNQELFRACDLCGKLYHFSCMTTTSLDNEIVWICSICKGPELTSNTQDNTKQQHRSSSFVHQRDTISNDNPTIADTVTDTKIKAMAAASKSLPDASQALSSAQIASRHVVSKDLPIFVGKPEQWPMFLSRFENSTKLCGFSDSENLDRLQKCLKGNALEAVRSRLLTAESVPEIMSTLKMLYGRPELIVNSLMKKIRAEPSPRADKLNTLVDFALSVKNVCATLEQANLHYHLSNPALIQELVEKLPINIKIDWAKHKLKFTDITLSTLGNFLYDLAKVISTITEPTFNKESKEGNKPKNDSVHKDYGYKDTSHVYVHQSKFNKHESTDVQSQHKSKTDSDSNSSSCKICNKKCQKVEICPVFLSYDIDRRWKEMYNKKLCRKCLERHGRFCNQAKTCGVSGCIFKHHSLLHDEKKHSQEAIERNQAVTVTHNNNVHFSSIRNVLLRIVPVTLYMGDKCIKTFAYQDDGSDISMVEESLVNLLGISGPLEPLCLLWTGDVHRRENQSKRVEMEISGQDEFSVRYLIRDARTVESLGLPIQTVIKQELIQRFSYLKDSPIIDYNNAVPQILIGSDNANLNVPLEIIEGNFNQPIACKSRIGWSIHGRTDNRTSKEHIVNIHRLKCPCQHQIDEDMHQLIKEHFTLENFGVQANKNLQFCSKEDERALDLLKKYTRRIGNRYETALLWKYDQIKLPDSYAMAYKRLQCLEKYKPEVIQVIDQTIQDYLRKGYASKLTKDDIQNAKDSRIWYLPIFTVSYPKKPEKVRVVFDGAAKVNGVSLNSLLLKGPDQLSSLVDILRRFREKRVGAVGDITEMFPQIKIRREDVHAQRFLWRNGDTTKEPDQYILEVMTFGANCSPASAQFVKNRNASEFEKEFPRAVESIIKNHYVDDMLDCQHSDSEMIQLVKDVKKIHSHGGFEIRKFLSNSAAVKKQFNENRSELQSDNCMDMSFGTERVLGMWWNTEHDCFTFSLKFTKIAQDIITRKRMPTKRELLKILMSIFDPLGLLSHYLIHLKIILQDVWRSNLGWDDEISSDKIKEAWNDWFELLPNVEKIEIPRLYSTKMSPRTPKSIELHIFVDASEKAFSAVGYLRVEDDDGVDCSLVGSKTRVAPLKYLSIPRTELQAGVLGVRLLSSIANAQNLKIDRRQIWTDSRTLLSWICSDNRKYHQFVAHRVGEILETTNLKDWRWIPSQQNVADDATKWSKPPSFQNTSRWFSGPEFLKLPKSEWPDKVQVEADTLEEMKVHYAHSNLIIPILIETKNISNWNKMHRAMAYVRRYVFILRARVKKTVVPHGPLTRDELVASEIIIFRQAQYQDFTEEMVLLKRNQILPKDQQKYVEKSSPLYKCSPYLDANDLIRLHGRIDSAKDVAYSTKRPIILPRNNRITRLLVAHFHRSYHHRNHRTVYNEIRQKYYIPQLRVLLNSIRKECQQCKNKLAKPQPPEMADLPLARLAIGFRAFTYVGIDYFGPMHVVIGRRNEKRWGVLITCLTVRAVHVEIANKMDTQSCIMCIRNFINLRGCPEEIYSDQGTNMKGMDNQLKALVSELDFEQMASEFTSCYTKWCFNPPASPHMGGVWERMVRSVKTCLYDILPTKHPTEDMLRNLLLEVCNIINSRPLTYIPLDHEYDDILTPNHFILGSSNGLKPMINIDSDGPILRSKWMENQRLTDIFWTKFVKEFLPDLTRRTKWFEPVKPIQVGDIVLLVDGTNIRGQYPRARVIETSIGSNDQVRRARIQRFSNNGSKLKKSILWRPVTSLAKLDVHPPKTSLPVESGNRQTEGSVMNGNTGLDKTSTVITGQFKS